jgi:hypothetical protein
LFANSIPFLIVLVMQEKAGQIVDGILRLMEN